MERDWKSVALLSLGFSFGVAYTVACGDKNPHDAYAAPTVDTGDNQQQDSEDDDQNDDTGDTETYTPPSPDLKVRTVLTLDSSQDLVEAWLDYYDGIGDQPDDRECWEFITDGDSSTTPADCCPAGFTMVGTMDGYPGAASLKVVCLEDLE